METVRMECEGSGVLPIESLVPFQGALKTLSKENYVRLKAGILADGFGFVVFVWQHEGSNYIIDGHQRINTLTKMKEEGYRIPPVPIALVKAPTYKAAKKRVLAAASVFGRIGDEGLYEFVSNADIDIDELLEKYDLPGVDVERFKAGYGGDSGGGGTDPDDVPEPPKVARSKLGDLYELGGHRLLCGDSTKWEEVAKVMGKEKADMVFTDPPYGVSYADKNRFLNTISLANRSEKPIEGDHGSIPEMYEMWCSVFNIAAEATHDKATYYICSPQGGELMMMMMQAIDQSPWSLKHTIIWNKNNHVLGRADYNYKHEPILYGWKKKGTHIFYGAGDFKTSVWDVAKPLKNDLHPTMKPIALMEGALLNSSTAGDKVFEPFCGSGSTLIACEKTGRKCYGMELDPIYCDVIVKRWEDFTGKQAVLIK